MRLNNVRAKTQFLALATALLVACATTKPRHVWTDEALAAETMQFEGRLDEAEQAYEKLLPDAPNNDKRRWLQLNVAMLYIERGDVPTALDRLAALYEEDVLDLHGANALYEAARLHDESDPGEAERLRLDLIRRYPDQIAAEFALQDIVSRKLAAGEPRALEKLLVELADAVDGGEVADNVLLSLATVRDEQLKDPDGALDTYRRIYRDYRKGPLSDDALWEMGRIYRRHQLWEPAVIVLTMLAEDREESWFIGSYDSDWVDDAMYELGLIHLLFLDDHERAIKWFKSYLKEYPEGVLSDDAAWHIVQAYRIAGDEAAHARALRAFVEDFPWSRHAQLATERLGDAHDPG